MPLLPGRTSSPLDDLPRPLSERRSGSRVRRVLGIGLAASVLGTAGFAASASWDGGSFDPVGAVAGAVGTGLAIGGDASVAPDGPPASELPMGAGFQSPPAGSAVPTREPAPTPTADPTPLPVSALTGYQWPLPRGRITLPFGPTPWGSRMVDGEKFHDGLDLATFCGDRVVAAHAGTVLAANRHYDHVMGWVGDIQPYLDRLDEKKLYPTLPIVVVIDDGNGYRSIYAHFSKVVVKKGQQVKAGQFLGYEGMTGRASGCHLHYGLFSPIETATFDIDPAVVKRMKVPKAQIARVDPLLVLPDRPKPSKSPDPAPSASPSAAVNSAR